MIEVYIVRHAESEGNVQKHLKGGRQNHLRLTARGVEQAQQLANALQTVSFAHAFCSPAHRAHTTCEIILSTHTTPISVRECLVERTHGIAEGRLRSEVEEPFLRAKKVKNMHFSYEGGESTYDVLSRVAPFISELEHMNTSENKKILCVSHSYTIRALLFCMFGSDAFIFRSIKGNTAVTKVFYDGEHWFLEYFNNEAHLTPNVSL